MDTTKSRRQFSSVWKTFERIINGKIRKFWVQDLPEDQIEVALDYMQEYFSRDNPLAKALNIIDDEISYTSYRNTWKKMFTEGYSLACYTKLENGEDKLVAINCCGKKSNEEPDDTIKHVGGDNLKKLFEIKKYVESLKNPFETLGISEYLGSLGMVVIPEYRGHNIGLELLRAREPLCIATSLKASISFFTAPASQRLAEKAGYKDLTSITFDEIEKRNSALKIPKINDYGKCIRFMYILYE